MQINHWTIGEKLEPTAGRLQNNPKKKNEKELLNCWNLFIHNALDPRKCNEKEKRICSNVTRAHKSWVYAKYTNTVTPLLSVPHMSHSTFKIGAGASLLYRNHAEITVVMCEPKTRPVWFTQALYGI